MRHSLTWPEVGVGDSEELAAAGCVAVVSPVGGRDGVGALDVSGEGDGLVAIEPWPSAHPESSPDVAMITASEYPFMGFASSRG